MGSLNLDSEKKITKKLQHMRSLTNFLGTLNNDEKDVPCRYIMRMYFHSKDAFNSSVFTSTPIRS